MWNLESSQILRLHKITVISFVLSKLIATYVTSSIKETSLFKVNTSSAFEIIQLIQWSSYLTKVNM